MKYLDEIHYEFSQFTKYMDTIIDPREADNDTLQAKVKEAIIHAYSHGYHDGQQAMYERQPKPTDTGGDAGGLEYYEQL